MKFFSQMLSTIMIVSLWYGCKSDLNKADILTNDYAMLNQETLKPLEIADMRKTVKPILEKRIKESNKNANQLEKDVWIYEATVKNSDLTPQDSLGGRWIDFKADFIYEYGSNDITKGKGIFHYDTENAKLLLMDNNTLIKPQEFDVKALNDMLVIVGTYEYKDNNIQSKLVRRPTIPGSVAPK
jgi:hypothetical protein